MSFVYRPRGSMSVEDRFWDKVNKVPGGCWLWLGHLSNKGYAPFSINSRSMQAHRWAYEKLVGPIPEGLTLDHLCRVRHCVNPDHLEAVTNAENLRRSFLVATTRNAAKTHCYKGHEFTPENTYRRPSRNDRQCIICRKPQGAGRTPSCCGRVVRVLVACEFSGIVRDAFIAKGHDAMSCDLLPTERPGPHYVGDVRDILGDGWDLMVAHPPCTYLSRAGARWWATPGRQALAQEAASFVRLLYDAPIPRVAIENPIGMLNRLWRYPDQTVQPWMFGEPYSKATCLWLRGLPPLLPSLIEAEHVAWLPSNVGAGRRKGQRSQPGIAKNARDASRTFSGIAAAMAAQWGSLTLENVA